MSTHTLSPAEIGRDRIQLQLRVNAVGAFELLRITKRNGKLAALVEWRMEGTGESQREWIFPGDILVGHLSLEAFE